MALIMVGMDVDEEISQLLLDIVNEYSLREPEGKARLIEDLQEVVFPGD